MDYIQLGLTKISEDIKDKKSYMKKILLPIGIAAGLTTAILGAKRLIKGKTIWKPGQREQVVDKIKDMFKEQIK